MNILRPCTNSVTAAMLVCRCDVAVCELLALLNSTNWTQTNDIITFHATIHILTQIFSSILSWLPQLPHDSQDWIEQCFTSPPTQYRLYGRRFLQVKRPNQRYQSTEGKSTKENNPENTKKTQNIHMQCIHTQNSRQIQHTSTKQQVP